ncbi:hypothetical protein [Chryseobacterium sp. Leaf405]|uniref:hypothetical protein n=1 Tax=Chryseobacterium sp. Leaf405 TaxID=1736367 RepID=UPI000ABFB7AA|nr:hypothetical protein [Chryseobacterium sp. Leaf405]
MKKHLLSFFLLIGIFMSAQTGNVGIGTVDPKSKLTVNGSFAGAYNLITNNTYAVAENDFSIMWNGSANGILTLPISTDSPDRVGRLYYFKNGSTAFSLTINANGTELIDDTNGTVIQPGESALLIKTNVNTSTGNTYTVLLLTKTQQPYMYTITGSANQTVSQGSTSTLSFSSVQLSTNGGVDFNSATSAWTCPQSGWYKIETTVQGTAQGSNSHTSLFIRKNGAIAGSQLICVPTVVSNSGSVSQNLNLIKGDQITVVGQPCLGCGSSTGITYSTRKIEIEKL